MGMDTQLESLFRNKHANLNHYPSLHLDTRLCVDQQVVDPLHRPYGLRLGIVQDQREKGAWTGFGGSQRRRGKMGPEADLDLQGFPQDRGAQGSCWSEAEQVAEALPCPDLGLSYAVVSRFFLFTRLPLLQQHYLHSFTLCISHFPLLFSASFPFLFSLTAFL